MTDQREEQQQQVASADHRDDPDQNEQSNEDNEKLMAEQEARLMLRTGGKLPEKPTNKLIKRDRKFFDSADYVIAGKNKAQTRQPAVAQLIKKRGVLEAFPKSNTSPSSVTSATVEEEDADGDDAAK